MLKRADTLIWFLVLIAGFRLLGMWWLPLADTSEPRYAEIARVMAQSGDWITPWFEPGVPFWGKPPLSFWSQALALRVLGVSDFAVRLPSWLATVATAWLIFRLTAGWYGVQTAWRATLIYSSMALVYVVSGAVLTDPFLVLGTTWAMTALALLRQESCWYWRYGFFLGLALGLLAKGPLALVLMALSLLPWWWMKAEARATLRALPWVRGVTLVLILVTPWYVAAELKTPGFLQYFLVGEHLLRFVDPGWGGDLYGSAHRRSHGTIWLYWLLATFPWGLIALVQAARNMLRHASPRPLVRMVRDERSLYLLGWALATPAFFTLAGNILWTYVLPALPAFSVLLAQWMPVHQSETSPVGAWRVRATVLLVPLGLLLFCLGVMWQPHWLKTEKQLVDFVHEQMPSAELVYIDSRPFSARYYSRGEAGLVLLSDLASHVSALPEGHPPLYLAVPQRKVEQVRDVLKRVQGDAVPVFENSGYQLFMVPLKLTLTQVPPPESANSSCQPNCSQARLTM